MIRFNRWPGSQVVRQFSAKELHGSSILPQALGEWWNGRHEGLKIL